MATTMRAAARSARFAKFLANRAIWAQSRRNYLSAQYLCEKEWNESRKGDPLLQNVNIEGSFVNLLRKIANKAETHVALDFDIFVNSIEAAKVLDELDNSLSRFRRSKHTVNVLPSSITAVVRYCLKNGFEDKLIDFLEDRHNYGIFPDTQTINIMLDHFLTRNMLRSAAKVAVHMALQEDEGNQISKTLSLIACARYLSAGSKAAPWKKEEPAPEAAEDDDDDEIQYVRVPNITNPWFDDHFDLTDPNDLLGKTLIFFGRVSEGAVRDSAILIGMARRQKWDDFRKELRTVTEISSDTKSLCLDRISAQAEAAEEVSSEEKSDEAEATPEDGQKTTEGAAAVGSAVPEWVKAELSKIKTNKATLTELLEKDVPKLGSVEEADIQTLRESIRSYPERRRSEKSDRDWKIERDTRFEALKKRKEELLKKEELLYAFENWNKIEMILTEVQAARGETKKTEEEYIPPEVKARFPNRDRTSKVRG
ncbi:28S ribosomal protein S27, mitochondrial [Galendromus occidentalis]|uniref:28S ribosomal protein S27, mitochondrial n=1 Tax=Galendromus occidentalis TaxID=34638 RepID=A0AAJ7P9N2_9ACAR|nr:28S ribosomal protein S27, mitochondrial [Galendromus occidentalis]